MTDVDPAAFATADGPLSKTTLTCPECGEAFTGSTRNAAQRARFLHVRADCLSGVIRTANRLKQHDEETNGDD